MEIEYDRIRKEWESYLRDRTVSLEYYEEISRGMFTTAEPYKVVLTAGPLQPVKQEVQVRL